MAAEIATLQFAEGVSVSQPSSYTSLASVTCADNQTDTDITGASWDKSTVQTVKLTASVFRRDDTQDATEVFEMYLMKDSEADAWKTPSYSSVGDTSGVTFSISTAGQLRYSSTSFGGANYSGTLRISNVQVTKV